MATSLSSVGRWLAGGLMLSVCGLSGAAENDRPPFYQFAHDGKQVWLLGSIHLGKQDFYPMPAVIEQAFDSAEALVVEADVGASTAEVQQLLQRYGLKPSTPDAKTASVLEQYCQSQQSVCAAFAPFSPWLQASQITVMRFSSQGYSAELGVDVTLVERARAGKTILELEGMEYQFALMSSLDESHQWAMVREAIEAPDNEAGELVNYWRSGNVTALDRLMRESMEEDGDNTVLKALLWDRNERMADALMGMLADADTPSRMMVVVGAGHLIGEHSLVSHLVARGMSVTSPLGHCPKMGCR